MADLITRCPKCSTAFRITEDLIKSAKGVVRCGSCLNVFNATEYLVKKPGDTTSKSQSVPMSKVISDLENMAKTTQTVHKTAASHAVASNSPSNKLKKPQVISAESKLNSPSKDDAALFERKSSETSGQLSEDLEDESDVDEAWALELLKEDEESDSPQPQLRKVIEPDKVQVQKEVEAKPPTELPEKIEAAGNANIDLEREDDDVNAPPSPTTAAPEERRSAPAVAKAPLQAEPTSNATHASVSEPEEAFSSLPETPTPESTNSLDANAALNPILDQVPPDPLLVNHSQESLISGIEIEPEPLDSILKERQKSLFSRIFWPSATFLALLGVIGQIFWIQFYRWNQEQPYRFIYQASCLVLDCEVPELINRQAIHTSNLVIRSHPEAEGALLVDVIIKNKAKFEQRFPSLRLTFTDIKNNALATRRFRADEYLGGELTGMTMMPRDQGIHIGLEIVDPGPKAVSYTIAIED